MSTTGCCRGLSAKDCAARPNGCFDEPERVFPRANAVREYASDRVFDGTRPLSPKFRAKLKARRANVSSGSRPTSRFEYEEPNVTPEERANKVVADWEPGTMRPLIASAIRAAENDVLDRAADWCDVNITDRDAGGAIRAMKHEIVKS